MRGYQVKNGGRRALILILEEEGQVNEREGKLKVVKKRCVTVSRAEDQ